MQRHSSYVCNRGRYITNHWLQAAFTTTCPIPHLLWTSSSDTTCCFKLTQWSAIKIQPLLIRQQSLWCCWEPVSRIWYCVFRLVPVLIERTIKVLSWPGLLCKTDFESQWEYYWKNKGKIKKIYLPLFSISILIRSIIVTKNIYFLELTNKVFSFCSGG